MAAGKYDFVMEQGATFKRTITWKNAVGNPFDLSSFTARLQIRESISAPTTFLSLTTENGGITLGGPLGTIDLLATADETAAIDVKKGVYDLEIVEPDGTVTRLLEGKVTITPEVTR